ncbi:Gfo/Idh/MocA family protein [Kribbella qitaiheensis]|uniref:Gfo/Idh/MocA family protein n=1 Tax=Kribbella qitaiheensis TaxID=1544730 RepID=UPI0036218BFF
MALRDSRLIRVAFIGAAGRARHNAASLVDSGAGEIAGFWSRTDENRARAAAEFGTRSFPTIESLVRDSGCDVVSIVTHPSYRAEPVERSIAAGASFVVVEKPLGTDLAQLERIAQAARSVPVVANTQYQWMPHWAAHPAFGRRRQAGGVAVDRCDHRSGRAGPRPARAESCVRRYCRCWQRRRP